MAMIVDCRQLRSLILVNKSCGFPQQRQPSKRQHGAAAQPAVAKIIEGGIIELECIVGVRDDVGREAAIPGVAGKKRRVAQIFRR